MTSYNNDNPILRRDRFAIGPYCHANVKPKNPIMFFLLYHAIVNYFCCRDLIAVLMYLKPFPTKF